MPPKSSIRVALAAACLLTGLGAFAGTSAGSQVSPRATAPKLLAHDVSGFGTAARRRAAKPGPQLLLAPARTRRAKLRLLTPHNDAQSDAAALNTSSDIGLTQFLVGSNGAYKVLSRTSSLPLLASVTNKSFWSGLTGPDAAGLCATSPQGEPSVVYDRAADRWVVAEAAFAPGAGPYVQCIAVSTTPDATGTWNRYVFQVSTTLLPDQPTIAVWSDGYYLSFNQHALDGSWKGAGALAVERSKMLTGAAAQARYFDLQGVTPGLGGMLPANISGTTAPTAGAAEPYLQAHDDPLDVHDRLEVWGFHVDWTAPVTGSTFQPVVNLPLNSGGFTIDTKFTCAQPGTALTWSTCVVQVDPVSGLQAVQMLEPLSQVYADASDALPQLGGRLQWASSGGNETLTAVATVNAGGQVAAPAWFNLANNGAGWTIGAKGIYGSGSSRFVPSAALDGSGEVGLAYAISSSTTDPSIAYTNASDNTFTEGTLSAGNVAFTAGTKYGRYTTLSIDPVGYCNFWFAGPLPASSGQAMSVGHFSFVTCVPSATQRPLLTGDPSLAAPLVREGLVITGTAATFTGATSTTYQWRRCDSRGLNCVDVAGENLLTHTLTAADAAGDRTMRFQETATNANGTSTAVSTNSTIVQSIPPVNDVRPVISGTAQAGQVLSTTNGTWTSSSPLSYTYRWRRCTSGVCANIGGANSSTYTATAADVGSTVDVVVSATNTGGGTDANAVETASVAAAPVVTSGSTSSGSGSSGGSSGGGSSGGGPGSPDLAVTGFASNAAPAVGDDVTFFLTVTDKNGKPAQQLYVTATLGAGLQFVSSTSDRGNGCAAATGKLSCFLDWLSSDVTSARLQITAKVTAATGQTFTGVASAAQGEFNAVDNTLSLTLNAAPAATTTTGTTTATSSSRTPIGLNGDGTPTKKQDRRRPTAAALSTPAHRGAVAKLRFKIYDDHGVAKAIATVRHGGAVVGKASTGFGPVAAGSVYFVGWHVPAKAAKGSYSFCVVAVDRAGNKSARSCAPLAVR